VGANVNGPNFVWSDSPELGHSGTAEAWGWNIVRVNTCLPPKGCQYGYDPDRYVGYDWHVNDDLDSIIKEYTERHIVVLIDFHQYGGAPGVLTSSQQAVMQGFWSERANRYKKNPYVWFNIANEPTGDNDLTKWLNFVVPSIRQIRNQGAKNIIVLDGAQWGQDIGDFGCSAALPWRKSALINEIPGLESVFGNIVGSLHAYGNDWGEPSCSESELELRLTSYLRRVHEEDVPVLIGETGWNQGLQPPLAVWKVAPSEGVGILYWHSSGLTYGTTLTVRGGWEDIDSTGRPTNLTVWGRRLWNLGHGLPQP